MSRHAERGQAVFEFAIAGTIALTLIFACIDFGRALYEYDRVAQAARIGTRYGIVNAAACSATGDACKANITSEMVSRTGIGTTGLTVTPTWTDAAGATCYASGCAMKVTIAYVFDFAALPLPTQIFTSSSKLVISQ